MKVAGSERAQLLRQGEALRWQRRYAEAAAVFEDVARQAQAAGDEDTLADALAWLAIVLGLARASDEDRSDLLSLQEKALAIDIRNHGDSHPRVADGLRAVAATLGVMGRPSEAIECLRRAATILRAHGNRSLCMEDTLARLESLLHDQGAYRDAIDVARELIVVCEHLQDPMRLTVAHVALAQALVEAGDAHAAIPHFERVLELAAPRIAQGRATRLVAEVNEWLARARSGEPQ